MLRAQVLGGILPVPQVKEPFSAVQVRTAAHVMVLCSGTVLAGACCRINSDDGLISIRFRCAAVPGRACKRSEAVQSPLAKL